MHRANACDSLSRLIVRSYRPAVAVGALQPVERVMLALHPSSSRRWSRLAPGKTVRHLTDMKRSRNDDAYSRISVKSQTVLPKQVREALGVNPGDTLRYRMTKQGVVIDKAVRAIDADDPFAAFAEWSGAADDEAYGDL